MESLQIRVKKLHPDAILPRYGTVGSAAFDLYAISSEDAWHNNSIVFGTGLAFEIPAGYVLKLYSRSGHGFRHGVRLANCVGIVDADYRGEVKIKLQRDATAPYHPDHLPQVGERVAQGLVEKVIRCTFTEADTLSTTARASGGFGSTGTS